MSSSSSSPAVKPATAASILVALLVVYVVWGSTYFAIRLALHGYAPFFFPGLRFLFAGSLLYAVLRLRGAPRPTFKQWGNAALIGMLLLIFGNGFVVLAERSVGSGLAATAVATVPLWSALFGLFWGQRVAPMQLLGLALGFGGIVVLNFDAGMAGDHAAAALLAIAAVSWSFGSLLSRRVDLPPGLMGAACEMATAGLMFLAVSALRGERWQLFPSAEAFATLAYLAVFGSMLAFSAYMYLNAHTTPALATSYAYVNPVIAVALGVLLGGETIGRSGYVAIALVLAGVALIILFNPAARRSKEE